MKIWIAQDDDGRVFIYTKEPTCKINGAWGGVDSQYFSLVPNEINGDLQEVEINIEL